MLAYLADTLALESSEHLRKLVIGHGMASLFISAVQSSPFGVPVKRERVGRLVLVVVADELVVVYDAVTVGVEKTERDLVFGVGLLE